MSTATSSSKPDTGEPGRREALRTRVAARGAAAVIAVVAGAASFEHIASVAIGAGERPWVGYSLPFAIDGLIVVGVAALLEDQRQDRRPRASARLAVLVGVIATLAANVASAEPTWTARLVALAAPVSFLLSVEVLTRSGRKLTTPDDNQPAPATTRAKPARTPAPRASGQRAATPRRRQNAAQRVTQAVAQTPTATPAEIAARLKVSERTVQRYWPTDHTPPAATSNGNGKASPASRNGNVAPVPAAAFTNPRTRTEQTGAAT